MVLRASVAGKVFLAGEYSVLWGGAAWVAACGPRLAIEASRLPERAVRLRAAGCELAGRWDSVQIAWEQAPPPALAFAAHSLDYLVGAASGPQQGLALALGRAALAPNGHKLGFGGSAQVAVLLAAAVGAAVALPADPLPMALVTHFAAQGRCGSGADVAAVHHGGLVRYRAYPSIDVLDQASALGCVEAFARSPAVDCVCLDAAAPMLAYAFCGSSASTPAMIDDVQSRLAAQVRASVVELSDQAGHALETALRGGDFVLLREAVAALQAVLASLGVSVPAAEAILRTAARFGCAGKVSGAGGGDGCILFAPDAGSRQRLVDALAEQGVYAFALELEAGVQIDSPSKQLT